MNFLPAVKEQKEKRYSVLWENGDVLPTQESVFEIIRDIRDPEHEYTLEDLGVVSRDRVRVEGVSCGECPLAEWKVVQIEIIPTIPHCSMVGLIGLSILYKLSKAVSSKYVVRVSVRKGTHSLDEEVTKQLRDSERTFSAFVNPNINSILESLTERE